MSEPLQRTSTGEFHIRSSIPVLRMTDEALAKSFYIDFLGFHIDWEHRFNDDAASCLYMQISQGDSVLHLNGHADDDTPSSEVRIPVNGLSAFCSFLRTRESTFPKPKVVDPRHEGRQTDMNVIDPFGNHLVFWAPSDTAGD